MRTFNCGRRVSCVCGMAVRYEKDIAKINMCGCGIKVTFPSKTLHPHFVVTSHHGTGKDFEVLIMTV